MPPTINDRTISTKVETDPSNSKKLKITYTLDSGNGTGAALLKNYPGLVTYYMDDDSAKNYVFTNCQVSDSTQLIIVDAPTKPNQSSPYCTIYDVHHDVTEKQVLTVTLTVQSITHADDGVGDDSSPTIENDPTSGPPP